MPSVNKISLYESGDKLPELPEGKICVWVGNHKEMSPELTTAIDAFCEANDAVVFINHASGYHGKYGVNNTLVENQKKTGKQSIDLAIYIGDVSAVYYGIIKNVWRVHPDGQIRDVFKKTRAVFGMNEKDFFSWYAEHSLGKNRTNYFVACQKQADRVRALIPDSIPFSNLWCASKTAHRLPVGCAIHLGILNSFRCWNYFPFPVGVDSTCNSGGFGIDGVLSTCIGASLAAPERLHYAVIGDLAFFYDMNAAGNRHIGPNLRILMVNNGLGTEFKNFNNPGAPFGNDANDFIAAAGHFGRQSGNLVRHYAQDLGFEYLTASGKEDFLENLDRFLSPEITDKPILFEIFTNWKDESDALETVLNMDTNPEGLVKTAVKKALGEKGTVAVKKLLGKG